MIARIAPVALLLLAAAAACSPTPAPSPTPTQTPVTTATAAATPSPTPASPSPSRSVTPSPSPTSTLSAEQEAAQAAAVEYFRALNAVRSDPDADFQQLADATTADFMGNVAQVVAGYRERGLVQVGEISYTYGAIGPVVEAGGVRSVEVSVCADSSSSDMVDEAGESGLGNDVSRFHSYKLDVVQSGPEWRVAGGRSEAVDSC